MSTASCEGERGFFSSLMRILVSREPDLAGELAQSSILTADPAGGRVATDLEGGGVASSLLNRAS